MSKPVVRNRDLKRHLQLYPDDAVVLLHAAEAEPETASLGLDVAMGTLEQLAENLPARPTMIPVVGRDKIRFGFVPTAKLTPGQRGYRWKDRYFHLTENDMLFEVGAPEELAFEDLIQG